MREQSNPIRKSRGVNSPTMPLLCVLMLATFAVASHAADFTNSLGMKFVRIGPNKFQMGSQDGHWDELPVHEVLISQAFLLGEREVTLSQFRQFRPQHNTRSEERRGHRRELA